MSRKFVHWYLHGLRNGDPEGWPYIKMVAIPSGWVEVSEQEQYAFEMAYRVWDAKRMIARCRRGCDLFLCYYLLQSIYLGKDDSHPLSLRQLGTSLLEVDGFVAAYEEQERSERIRHLLGMLERWRQGAELRCEDLLGCVKKTAHTMAAYSRGHRRCRRRTSSIGLALLTSGI